MSWLCRPSQTKLVPLDRHPASFRTAVDHAGTLTRARHADCLPSHRSKEKHNGDVFIPKRGEKDFEPLPPASTATSLTLLEYQQNQLINSRNALFSAISSGSRHHSSRSYNSFTWRPELDGGRATCDGASYGVHFGSMGVYNGERRRIELLPEEAIYLCERGAIEVWREYPTGEMVADAEGEQGRAGQRGEGTIRVPVTVQQTWAEMIGADELTIERYQVSHTSVGA